MTHLKRRVRGEVIASSADQNADYHLMITHLVHERVKRMVECKQDVVMLLDSITRLARASNRETSRRGRTMPRFTAMIPSPTASAMSNTSSTSE